MRGKGGGRLAEGRRSRKSKAPKPGVSLVFFFRSGATVRVVAPDIAAVHKYLHGKNRFLAFGSFKKKCLV